MTLTLILIRHAKSSWDDPGVDDHDRPLNARGLRSAPLIGSWLRDRGHLPDAGLVSTARRTRETWDGLGFETVPARFVSALYHASAPAMLRVLQGASVPRVAMVGHNPGIAEFAGRIVADAPRHPRFHDYPTCATLVAEFAVPAWSEVGWGQGRAVDFTVPRDLE